MRVKIFKDRRDGDLEKSINNWLEKYEDKYYKIIDIKYAGNGNISTYSVNEYSAMIIYE